MKEENATFEEINETLHEQLIQTDEEISSLQEDLKKSRQEAEKAQKQADKYQKRMNELAPMVKNMEKLAADFSVDPEQTLPESGGCGICKIIPGEKGETACNEKWFKSCALSIRHIWIFQISLRSCKRLITGNGAETSG